MRIHYSIPLALFVAWIVGCAFWWYPKTCCGAAATVTQSGLLIKDGATTVASSASKNLLFGFSSAVPNTKPVAGEYQKLAAYLKGHPDKTLTLTGLYKSDEKNDTSFDNLGLGRAESMKKYLIGMGVAASQIVTASALDNKIAFVDKQTVDGLKYSFKTLPPIQRVISISDVTNKFTAGTKDNFVFPFNSFDYKTPVSKDLNTVFGETAEYLKKHSDRSLKITGYYVKGEKNKNLLLPNMGMARANNIKKILIGLGVPSKQLEIAAREIGKDRFRNDELVGGAEYTFFGAPKADNRLADIEKKLSKGLILYFNTNQQDANLTSQERQFFADLIYYLDQKSNAKVNLTGHTDDRGEADNNMRLGRKRAEFVRGYLSKNGINQKQTNILSRGEESPVETNDTDEGRAKNRRVVVSIK